MTEDKKIVIPCEVYSRVVGYYRPVSLWNVGKKMEFKERKMFDRSLIAKVEDEVNKL
jgi:ribonucleoside-triphosphate reductase